jgi:hypothetical protein
VTNQCGHRRCDICGGLQCEGKITERFGDIEACHDCASLAVKRLCDESVRINTEKRCGYEIYNRDK